MLKVTLENDIWWCEFVDEAENLARDRANQLFGVEYRMYNRIQDHRQIWLS
ncbi:MAG: hypothetical protein CM1200mP10_05900 [Candidatus Neomarinimicrobiota bacterium]|nr:MAG: hypothetical protein CM1200mP10_05900 [Candidatus Neomarinimicrobiota bacterium]